MRYRNTTSLAPRLEALEERLALSVTALAVHASPSAHVMHTPPSPVIVNLTPDATGIQITGAAVDPRLGVIRIQGVVTYPPVPSDALPFTTSIYVSASQAIDRLHSVSGNQSSTNPINYDSNGFTYPFTMYIPASSGRFAQGIATVTVSTNVPYYEYPQPTSPSADVIVSLRPVRL